MNTIITTRFIMCHDELKRLKIVRSSRQFAISLDYLPQSLSEILKGRRDVTLELLRKGVEVYQMNPIYLLTGEGDFFSSKEGGANPNMAKNTLELNNVIYFVPNILNKKYSIERRNKNFLNSLEVIQLPRINKTNSLFRAFEMNTDKWNPTFSIGDILVSEKLDPTLGFKSISSDKMYVLVTKSNLYFNKIDLSLIKKDLILLHYSDKRMKNFEIKISEILEIWEVKTKITGSIENENVAFNVLLSDIKDIKQMLYNSTNALV